MQDNNRIPQILSAWAPVILWAGLIFTLSGIPHLSSGWRYDFLLRKIAHITEYFIFTLLAYRGLRLSWNMNPMSRNLATVAFALTYALLDEIHQSFVPGRAGTLQDVLFDAVGIIVFFLLLKIWRRKIPLSGADDPCPSPKNPDGK